MTWQDVVMLVLIGPMSLWVALAFLPWIRADARRQDEILAKAEALSPPDEAWNGHA